MQASPSLFQLAASLPPTPESSRFTKRPRLESIVMLLQSHGAPPDGEIQSWRGLQLPQSGVGVLAAISEGRAAAAAPGPGPCPVPASQAPLICKRILASNRSAGVHAAMPDGTTEEWA